MAEMGGADDESFHDDYPDDCDDYYGLSGDSDRDDTILKTFEDNFTEDLKCRTLKLEEVEKLITEDVDKISQKLKIPWWLCSLFLRSCNWDSQKVEDAFNNDIIYLLTNASLIPSNGSCCTSDSLEIMELSNRISQNPRPHQFILKERNLKPDVCSICFSSPSVLEGIDTKQYAALATPRLFGMSCGHMFCLECWRAFFNVRVANSHVSIVECMAAKCDLRIPDDFIFAVLNDPESIRKHQKHILNEAIEAHPRLRPCTDTHCDRVILAEEAPRALRVRCGACGTQFCFGCCVEYHAPAHCETIKQWLQKCRDDSGTANYMAAHTKDCPKCGVVIEKNGGCNHMQCLKCQHQFCWVCLGPWQEHPAEYYDCSKYRKTEVFERESIRTRAREFLQRYLFYYERWENHERSLRLEAKHYESIQERIRSKMQNREGTWIDWQYLLDAAETLQKCRYTLKYTYPYVYCNSPPSALPPTPPRPGNRAANNRSASAGAGAAEGESESQRRLALFEYQQALLEAEVEDLAWKISRAEITDRGELLNKMNICEKHRRTLIREFY